MEQNLSLVQTIIVIALPLIFAIVFHEVAHGWVADKLGDPTARNMGRLTLNPIRHIDPFGTILMPLMLFVFTKGGFVFGYAKPVPINPYNFRDPKKGMALSSVAGPAVNMIMAVIFAVLLRIVLPLFEQTVPAAVWDLIFVPLSLMFGYGVVINVVLAVLNMVPIPPLDGSRIVYWILPASAAQAYYRLERMGLIILVVLISIGALGKIINPIIQPLLAFMLGKDYF